MALALLDASSARSHAEEQLGVDPLSDEGIFELLRGEVHARTLTPRASTIERVARLLRALAEVDAERIGLGCDALTREGDLVLAAGGLLASTPLRAVPLLSGHARLFCSLPTKQLASVLGSAVARRGAARSVRWDAQLPAVVERTGGRVVTPEAWAGLDRAPLADAEFIRRLNDRVAWGARAAGSLERDEALDWRGWTTGPDAPAWKKDAPNARLWMARAGYRGRRCAWTGGDGAPSQCAFVELSSDDADRARLALSRVAGVSPVLTVTRTQGSATLASPAWLPRSEYRWLYLVAEVLPPADGGSRWRVADDQLSTVMATLADRLGLRVEER